MDYTRSVKPQSSGTVDSTRRVILSTIGSLLLGAGIILGLGIFWLGPIVTGRSAQGTQFYPWPFNLAMTTADALRIVVPGTLGILLMSMLALHLRALRRRRARLVLNHLAAAVNLGLPLPAYLQAGAAIEDRGVRRRLMRLADLLERGTPIGTALHLSNGELDLRIPLMIEAAEKTGQLDATLQRLNRPAESSDQNPIVGSAGIHLLVMVMTMYSVVFMVLIFVMPKFAEIFRDFSIDLPTTTQWLLSIPWEPLSLLIIPAFILTLAILARSAGGIISSTQRRYWYAPLIDRVIWHTPLIARLTRHATYADFAWIVGGAIATGHTVRDALSAADRVDVNSVFRQRLSKLQDGIHMGNDLAVAAAEARMPDLLVSLFKTPGAVDLARALRFAASAYAARRNRIVISLQAVLPVLMTLLFAAAVAFIAIALFQPLVSLIEAMAPKGVRL
ncbi:MAG: type II secretion system F family protein [Burkholderiales bacterium]|nr:type II secretion system F family protein [Phycisphaerae bacterium]